MTQMTETPFTTDSGSENRHGPITQAVLDEVGQQILAAPTLADRLAWLAVRQILSINATLTTRAEGRQIAENTRAAISLLPK